MESRDRCNIFETRDLDQSAVGGNECEIQKRNRLGAVATRAFLGNPIPKGAKPGLCPPDKAGSGFFSKHQQGFQLKFVWDRALRSGQRSGQLMPPLSPRLVLPKRRDRLRNESAHFQAENFPSYPNPICRRYVRQGITQTSATTSDP